MAVIFLLMFALLACGVPVEPPATVAEAALFPHASDYQAASAHGVDSLPSRGQACASCHSSESATAPACSSCHEAYPHPEGWSDGAAHGAGTWGDGGSTESCDDCHATPGTWSGDNLGCTACHASWPHPEGWDLPGVHGTYALARGADAACGSCHGTDLAGGSTEVACTSCHAIWPHPAGFASAHAPADPTSECGSCHGGDLMGGNSGVACSTCHATWPHPDGWERDHLAATTAYGEGTCLLCHDPGFGPAAVQVTCARACHGGAK